MSRSDIAVELATCKAISRGAIGPAAPEASTISIALHQHC